MNRFQRKSIKNIISLSLPLSVLLFAGIIIAFLYGIVLISGAEQKGNREHLESIIEKDITCCYSIEGRFPPSLEYIEQNYGFTYDKSQYIIDYDAPGANIRPTVMILEKNK